MKAVSLLTAPDPVTQRVGKHKKVRCEAVVQPQGTSAHTENWRKRRYGEAEWNRCAHEATVEIDNTCYCSRHGGMIALAHVLFVTSQEGHV